jgi:hypothetical protein
MDLPATFWGSSNSNSVMWHVEAGGGLDGVGSKAQRRLGIRSIAAMPQHLDA